MRATTTDVIAEVGSVHDGSLGNALSLVRTAAACGADTVKFQLHIAAAESTLDAPSPSYFSGEPRFAYFERTGFTAEQWRSVMEACEAAGVEFLCSAFSIAALEILEGLGVRRHKVASGEVTNVPLLEAMAATGKPVLLSSGMSTWSELDRAVAILSSGGEVTILQCASQYPCAAEHVGLNVLAEMASRYGRPVGFSDHTRGIAAPIAAVALGATVIEKHLTFSKLMYGSDAPNATEPEEFASMVESIRAVELMLANRVDKDDVSPYEDMKAVFEKSVVTVVDIPAGAAIERSMIDAKKPGTGIPAAALASVVGRTAARDLRADLVLQEADLQ